MRKIVAIAVVAMVLVAGGALGQTPSISSGSGTFATGNSFTLQGNDFGTKNTAAPMKYDDFESGADGALLTGWQIDDGGTPLSGVKRHPEYSGFETRPGSARSVMLAFEDQQYLNTFGVYEPSGLTTVYMDFWMFVDRPAGPQSRNHKVVRLYPSRDSGKPNCYLQWVCDDITWQGFFTNDYVDGAWNDTHAYTAFAPDDAVGNWIHVQAYLEQSDSGVTNGVLKAWFNGDERINRSDYMSRGPTENADWASLWFGNFYSTGTDQICLEGSEDTELYFDNVYVDVTQARVEAGNNADYNSCTHREIQIPTAWNSSQVDITVNAGSFNPGEQVWLFVVNDNGGISSGRGPFLVDGTVAPDGPGQPGKPVQVN